jgi:hypothetical protein
MCKHLVYHDNVIKHPTACNPKTVPDRLRTAAQLFEERNALYRDDYKATGTLMRGLFPNGLGDGELTDTEMARLSMVCKMAQKLGRYAANLRRGGHADSLSDLAVYAMMAQEMDET